MAVAKLPAMTGLSMTEAIRQAVEEKLARMRTPEAQMELVLVIGRDCAARLAKKLERIEHGGILYESDPLPA